MHFEAVAVLGLVIAVKAIVLIHGRMTLQMGVEHGLVDACVGTDVASIWFGTNMDPDVVFKMVLVFCHKLTFRTLEHLFWTNVLGSMGPGFSLRQ